MNEDVVTAVAETLAVCRLEPEPSRATLAVARTVVRTLRDRGWDFTKTAGTEPAKEAVPQ